MKILFVSLIAITNINYLSIAKGRQSNFSDDTYLSSPVKISNLSYDIPNIDVGRYIIYDNDESTCFSDAITIYQNVQYSYYFNDHNDDDYFKCSLDSGSIITVNCNKQIDLAIYRISGSNIVQRFNTVYSQNTKLVLDASSTYYFVITGPGNYTGRYSLQISTYEKSDYDNNYNYVNLKFINNNLVSSKLVTFNDFSSLPNEGYKDGYCGTYNNIQFINDYVGGDSLYYYGNNAVSGNPLDFVNSAAGIYNSNNISTGEQIDDNRCIFGYNTYVASAIPLLKSNYVKNFQYSRSATAFYVDQDFALSAAHMVYDPQYLCFPTSMVMLNAKHPNNTNYNYTIPCIELYIPYSYVYHVSTDSSFNENTRNYDWSVIKINSNAYPSTYIHSYLGLKYPYDTNLSYYNFGYPSYVYDHSESSIMNDYPDLLNHRILAGMSGTIYTNNGFPKSYMDESHGNSGGPCLYKNNNLGIAIGIVSGNGGVTGNVYSPINKYNFGILNKYLNGII